MMMKRGPPSTLVACVACHESHVVCGPERPCKRCVTRGLGDSCKDIAPKKRGRPRKDQQQAAVPQDGNNTSNFGLPLSPDSTAPFGQFTNELDGCFENTILNRPSSDPYLIEHNVQQMWQNNMQQQAPPCLQMQNNNGPCMLMQNNPACPLMQNNPCPLQNGNGQPTILSPSSGFSTSCSPSSSSESFSPATQISSCNANPSCNNSLSPLPNSCNAPTSSPSPSSSPSPALSPAPMAVPEPGPYCLSGTSKFTSKYLESIFTSISQRMGYDTIPPSLSPLLSKLVDFYDPLISMYGNRLLDMCPQRLMYINQLINEMNIPIIVYGVFSVINVNSAVRELLRQTKSHLLNKYIFDLIHPDDIAAFVKNSVECLVDFKEMERIRVRMLLESDNYCQCVLTETIHKNQNGVPLFSSLAIMRVDDV